MAEALRIGYKELYDRNEYAHALSRDKLNSLVIEITGAEKDNRAAQAIASTFWTLKELADFEGASVRASSPAPDISVEHRNRGDAQQRLKSELDAAPSNLGFNVAYTINLNLPETTNPEVFNAIFKALRENLLR